MGPGWIYWPCAGNHPHEPGCIPAQGGLRTPQSELLFLRKVYGLLPCGPGKPGQVCKVVKLKVVKLKVVKLKEQENG